MESSCPPSSTSTTTTAAAAAPTSSSTTTTTTTTTTSNISSSTSNIDRNAGTTSGNSLPIQSALRQLNKTSYKISKESGGGGSGDSGNPGHHRPQPPPLPPQPPPPGQQPQPQPQPQPPVYNIHKNDFRDVVQKLTGSPAHPHPRLPSPPAAPAPAPPKHALPPAATGGGTSSRLQKIRPPPLAQLTPRPPPPLAPATDDDPLPQAGGSGAWGRAPPPLSPLPPFPAVSAAAESPITAYMRCLRSGGVPYQQALIPSPRGGFSGLGLLLPPAPSSPLPFGCVPPPRSACQVMLSPSPGLVFPPSPTPSPRCGEQ